MPAATSAVNKQQKEKKTIAPNTILHSPKCLRGPCNKALKNQDFRTEFAKISLLTNVGRINTTMTF
jgi:hypothetical protein